MKDTTNVICYMRRSMGLTQKQLAKTTGLTLNDISRAEGGIINHRMEKFIILSKYFCIPLEAILNNNIEVAVHTFNEPQ